MALFRRKDKTTIAELEDYYANERANRNGRAWAMALLSILLTIVVIVALFFGVRWLWQTFVDDDADTATTDSSEVVDVELPTFDSDVSDGSTASNDDVSGSEGVVSDEAATTTRDVAGTTDENIATSTDSNTTSETVTATGTSDADNTTAEIPNTGTGELLLALPLAAGFIGYAASLKQKR